jgi:hypothetical protein
MKDKMKLVAIAIIVSLTTAVVILSLFLRQWVEKARDASSQAHILSEQVHTLRRLLKEKEKKALAQEGREILEELRYIPGEVLVRFKEELTNEEKTALINKWGFELIEKVVLTDIHRLRVPAGMAVSEAVEKLEILDEVKHAQPNWIYRIEER